MMKKLFCLLFAGILPIAGLAACRTGTPTPLESTADVWVNPSTAEAPEVTFETARDLINEIMQALMDQKNGVDAAQVERAANLIIRVRVYHGSESEEGRYLQAVGDAYERVYGFYLKNSSEAQLAQALAHMDETQQGLSKLLQESFLPLDHTLFEAAAEQFDLFGDQVIERLQSR